MKTLIDCDYCGSAGSVEFNMCQVCLKDHSPLDDGQGGRLRVTALSEEVDRIIMVKTLEKPPASMRGFYVA